MLTGPGVQNDLPFVEVAASSLVSCMTPRDQQGSVLGILEGMRVLAAGLASTGAAGLFRLLSSHEGRFPYFPGK